MSSIVELFDLLEQDIFTDAPEYRERVERVRELVGELKGVLPEFDPLPSDEVEG